MQTRGSVEGRTGFLGFLQARLDAGQIDGRLFIAGHAIENRTVAVGSSGITPRLNCNSAPAAPNAIRADIQSKVPLEPWGHNT